MSLEPTTVASKYYKLALKSNQVNSAKGENKNAGI
ncbi:hypothetical protein VIS19158_04296 [Vibrio scophthalmi LMG 19158]|uniref:Uncharacterized protein n=1 Tax=Vibrio scophthalmi LMG 19158 TaxID=870967 RepID=F9RJA8_9VIBR|nr:hypothetical protein VIS19158_04296 [Vibrio scophthalmi LMG 19158]